MRVLSDGYGGDVTQTNSVDSSASAGNLNATKQYADQDQGGKDKCCAVRRHPGDRPGCRQQAEGRRTVGRAAVRCEQHEHPGSRRQQGRRRRRLADEQRRVERDRAERQPDRPEGRSGAGRRLPLPVRRHAGHRAEGQERPVRRGCVAGGPVLRPRQVRLWLEREHEHSRPRRQLRRRRLGRAVEQRRVVGRCRQPERALPGRWSDAVRLRWHPGRRPGGQERAGRAGPLGGAAVRRIEREHAGARGQQGR